MDRRTRTRVVAVIMAVLLVVPLLAGLLVATGGDDGTSSSDPSAEPSATLPRFTDLPTVSVSQLPPEGRETLELIIAGGPFPYERDGLTFQNREGLLPEQPEGHYREFTVPTPGEGDRGARRFVTGADGEFFYTEDHYESFRELVVG